MTVPTVAVTGRPEYSARRREVVPLASSHAIRTVVAWLENHARQAHDLAVALQSEVIVTAQTAGLAMHIQGKTFPGDDKALAQVGWLGQTGAVYALADQPMDAREPGGFAPLYIQIGTYMRDEETGRRYIND